MYYKLASRLGTGMGCLIYKNREKYPIARLLLIQ